MKITFKGKRIILCVVMSITVLLSSVFGTALAEEGKVIPGASSREWLWRAKITSNPAGADVYADPKTENKYLGKTPLEVTITTITLKEKAVGKGLQTTTYNLPTLMTKDGYYCIFLIKKGDMERTEQGFFSNPLSPATGGSIAEALREGKIIRMTGNFKDVETPIPDGFKFPADLVNEISVDFNKKVVVEETVKPKPGAAKPKEEELDINSLIDQLVESRNNSGTLELLQRGDVAEKIKKIGIKAVPFLIQNLKSKQMAVENIKGSSADIVQVQIMMELSILKEITKQDFGNDSKKWQEWWEKNKEIITNKRQ